MHKLQMKQWETLHVRRPQTAPGFPIAWPRRDLGISTGLQPQAASKTQHITYKCFMTEICKADVSTAAPLEGSEVSAKSSGMGCDLPRCDEHALNVRCFNILPYVAWLYMVVQTAQGDLL